MSLLLDSYRRNAPAAHLEAERITHPNVSARAVDAETKWSAIAVRPQWIESRAGQGPTTPVRHGKPRNDRGPAARIDLVFMVAGDDENGDHHIFVTTDKARAEARHQTMLAEFTSVKANWLDK